MSTTISHAKNDKNQKWKTRLMECVTSCRYVATYNHLFCFDAWYCRNTYAI